MAKKQRKYGEAWKDVQIDVNQFDKVFDRFIKHPVEPVPAEQPIVPLLPDAIPPQSIPPEGIPQHGTPAPTKSRKTRNQSTPQVQESMPEAMPAPDTGYYPTYNDISDKTIPDLKLDTFEQAILWRLYRLSRGWKSQTCTVGHGSLARHTVMSRSKVQETIDRLIKRGLIENLGSQGKNRNEGTTYSVLPSLPATPQKGIPHDGIPQSGIPQHGKGIPQGGTHPQYGIPQHGHNKNSIKDFKNIDKKGEKVTRLTPEEIQMYAATAKDLMTSGETLEEIHSRRYAGLHPDDWQSIKENLPG